MHGIQRAPLGLLGGGDPRSVFVWAFVLVCVGSLWGGVSPGLVVVDGLTVDGSAQPLPLATGPDLAQLRLSPGPHQLRFNFGPPDASGPTLRLRYKLEGLDAAWQEAGGEMRLTLMVLNSVGDVLGLFESSMRGESAGWSNSLAQSRFTSRSESEVLPPDAHMLRVIFNSGTWDTRAGASHPTVGMAVIDDCRIWVKDSAGQKRNLWPNSTFDEGDDLDQPSGRPRGWTRGGMGRGITRLLMLPGGQGHALGLVDDNPRSGAEWRCDVALDGLTLSGRTVTLEWKELFAVGAAGGHTADYHYVPPGDYVFRVEAYTPTGEPTGHRATLAFTIPQVLWRTTPFLAASGIGFAVVVAGVARAVTRRRMRREFVRLEQQRTLERERARIARDIHDDLGTSLTRVALLSQSIRGALQPDSPAAEELEQISATSQAMTRALEEIVWAVDPTQDSLDSIANYCGRFAQDFLSAAGISCRLDLPVQLPPQTISADVRHNLFLTFKETLNNVVRHSGARRVDITLSVTATRFALSIEDDGRGFEPGSGSPSAVAGRGYGLANIQQRLAQIDGEAQVTSAPGKGTLVRLSVPFSARGVGSR